MPLEDLKDSVDRLVPVRFTYKDGGNESIGLIAEEVEEIFPEYVPKDKEGLPLTVNYSMLTVPLIQKVQKLQVENDTLKNTLDTLQSKVNTQDMIISQLISRLDALENN